MAREHKPKMIIAGASAYPRTMDYAPFREIADEIGAMFLVDMAHIAGLVAAGLHPSPVPLAEFVTSTTHKTLRGPRGGIILCKEPYAAAIDKSVFPGIQGGPLMHTIAAKAVAFGEALAAVVHGLSAKCDRPTRARWPTNSCAADCAWSPAGTDTHLMLVDVSVKNLTGKAVEAYLDRIGITVNKNAIPYDQQKPMVASGIRIGTPAITSRGLGENDCREVARIIVEGSTTSERGEGRNAARARPRTHLAVRRSRSGESDQRRWRYRSSVSTCTVRCWTSTGCMMIAARVHRRWPEAMCAEWRKRQLQLTNAASSSARYVDFDRITLMALLEIAPRFHVQLEPGDQKNLIDAWAALPSFADVGTGIRCRSQTRPAGGRPDQRGRIDRAQRARACRIDRPRRPCDQRR